MSHSSKNPRALPYSGPQLRLNGPDLNLGNPTWTIPNTIQVGDYLVITGNNGNWITTDPNSGGYGWASYYGQGSSSSYSESAWIKIKVANDKDIGNAITLTSGGNAFMANCYVFTNPNNTNMDYFAAYNPWAYRSTYFGYSPAYYSGARSQFTFPAWNTQLGPNCLRLFVGSMNGDSTHVSSSWSSGLTATRALNDGYWWRGTTSGYITGATGLETPTVYFNQGGALAWMEMYLP